MKRTRRNLMATLLAIFMMFATAGTIFAAEPAEGSREIYDSTGAYFSNLIDNAPLQVGSTGGEWIVIGLARSGKMSETQIETYYQTAARFVEQNANNNEQLHRAKSTENSRLILALTAIGKDVTDVNGHNLLNGLSDQKYLEKQGINGPIWALIALDSGDYEIPVTYEGGTQASRDSIIESILEAQQESGWWALSGMGADPDITGMAIQALAPYYASNDNVKNAVDAALAVLSESQAEDGSFASTGFFGGTSNIESVAQVVVALTALGIDPHTDPRFIKNGHSVIDALCSFAVESGGFRHVAGGNRDGMSSEQGYYALTAYFRYLDGKTSLYDMSDLKEETDPGKGEDPGTTPGESENPGTTPDKGEDPETTPSDGGSADSTQSKQPTTSPQTGNNSHIGLYLCLLSLSLIGIIAMTALRGKENQR